MWERHELDGRPLFVRAPDDRSLSYPTVYVLHAHMRSAQSWFNVTPFERSYPELIDDLGLPCVVALVDGWTDVGGGQWIGNVGAYLRDTVVPFVDDRYPTNGLRGLQGKSSGGYGAIVHALERPDVFQAFAAHAADALFEVTLAHGFATAARALRDRSLDDFWSSFDGLRSREDALVVELTACARAFGDGTLPFDPETGVVDDERFAAWLEHDPVRLAARHKEALASLRGAWVEAGRSDEYFLDLGALALRRSLLAAGLPEERLHFELVDGGHGGQTHRYPVSLAWLVERLG
jgi:S-formylglutathione hydrolase FrmB